MVPSSGQLNLLGLAQECLYGTYGSGNVSSPIFIYDLIFGGNTHGSGEVYPQINLSSPSHPPVSQPITMSSFYNYNKLAVACTTMFVGFDANQIPCGQPYLSQTYGFNNANFSSATVIYQDGINPCATCAAQGYYINGNEYGYQTITDAGCSFQYLGICLMG